MSEPQTVLVTGATGSIGGAAALALARRGAQVVLLGRRGDRLSAKAAAIRTALAARPAHVEGPSVATMVVDFSDLASVRRAASEASSRWPTVLGLVLSVGAYLQKGPTILPSGFEAMFATNVLGPFLFTQLLRGPLGAAGGLVLHVIAPFSRAIDWDDLQSIERHRTMTAFDRTKTCNRIVAGELARRSAGRVASVAFDPTYVIDKTDPSLSERWPKGATGLLWRLMTLAVAKHPSVAGEPIADLMLAAPDRRRALNGTLYRLDRRVAKPDPAMHDEALGRELWIRLARLTALDAT